VDKRLRVISDTEQDRAECRRWWADATEADKLRVWFTIQRDYADPAMEIMSRFAQLAFTEMLLAEEQEGG
jgi:hypothetical protein